MADEKLKARLGLDNSEFKKGLKDSENQLSRMNAGFKQLGIAVAAAFSVTAITNFVGEGIKLAASVEGVEKAFRKLNQPNLLQNLRTATRGTVTDLELMRKAVQAKNFKIPLEQLATYFEFATKRAIETGESVDYLVNSIITGIGRKSVLVMDNLGISAVELQNEIAKVGDFGTAAGNIIKRELGSMGDVADTAATSIAQISTAFAELKTQVGDFILKSGLKEYLEDIATSFEIWNDPNTKWFSLKSQTSKNLEEYRKEKKLLEEQQSVNMYSGGESSGGPLEKVKEQVETIASLNEQLKTEKENLEQINIADKKGLTTQLQVIDALQKRIDQLSKLPETRKDNPLIEMLSVPKGYTEENFNSWKKLWDDYKEFQKIQNKLADAPKSPSPVIKDMTKELMLQNDAINILANGFDSFFSSTENGFRDMMNTIISELQRLLNYYISKAVIFGLIKAFFPESSLISGGFKNFMGFPGFANGGMVFGPQFAMVGENSTRSNPEVIMPMNKLASMMGTQVVEVKGTIRGKDIALALRRNG